MVIVDALTHYVALNPVPHCNAYFAYTTLYEGMNRSLQEYLRCIINGNDTRYTEWSADVKLFPLAYNSQITTFLGMSPYEMVFNQKPRKPIMFTANSHKNTQGHCQPE